MAEQEGAQVMGQRFPVYILSLAPCYDIAKQRMRLKRSPESRANASEDRGCRAQLVRQDGIKGSR